MAEQNNDIRQQAYSARDTGRILGIGERSVWRLISMKELRAVRIGTGTTRILAEDLDAFLKSRKAAA